MVDRSYKQREEQADRQEHEEEGKKQQGEGKRGREETIRTSSGHAATTSCGFIHISPLSPPFPL
jgi:hypothetical protein